VTSRRWVSWDTENRKHLFVDHAERGITEEQVNYAVENASDENIAPDPTHGTTVACLELGAAFSQSLGSFDLEAGVIRFTRIGPVGVSAGA
jgi:hypothetical protein